MPPSGLRPPPAAHRLDPAAVRPRSSAPAAAPWSCPVTAGLPRCLYSPQKNRQRSLKKRWYDIPKSVKWSTEAQSLMGSFNTYLTQTTYV